MAGIFTRLFTSAPERPLQFTDYKEKSGISLTYTPDDQGVIEVRAEFRDAEPLSIVFPIERADEAHIFWMEITELLSSRSKLGQNPEEIRRAMQQLIAVFHGERIEFEDSS